MKRLSLWAYHHKGAARLLIVLCYVVLNATGFLVGDLLLLLDVHVSPLLVYLVTAAAIAAFIGYPQRKEKHRYANFYGRQKVCDGLLITSTFLFLLCAANGRQADNSPFSLSPVRAVVPVALPSAHVVTNENPEKKTSLFSEVKTRLTQGIQKVRNYYKRLNTTDKIILTALLALVALAALYGVIAWSCSLSCSGSEATGWIVLVAGTGVILFLVMWTARAINRAYRRRKDRKKEQQLNG